VAPLAQRRFLLEKRRTLLEDGERARRRREDRIGREALRDELRVGDAVYPIGD
jgi:hypothetical protein